MKKLIKNYTTEIPAHRTIAEIQQMLGENGVTGIATDWKNGRIIALYFRVTYKDREIPYRLPVKTEEVYRTLFAGKNQEWKYREEREGKALNIAWRICKLWLEAQLTHVNLGQAKIEEVFLPYMVVGDKLTLYESMEQQGFLLPSGEGGQS